MNKNGIIIIFTLHRVSEDTTPPSHIINNLTQHLASYTSFFEQPIEKQIDWEKKMKALEEPKHRTQNLEDSKSHQNFQVHDLLYFSGPTTRKEPTYLGKSIESMIQFHNDFFNRLEVLMSQLNDAYREEKTLPYQYLTNSNCPNHIDRNQAS